MCEPVSIGMAITSVASAAAQGSSARKAARTNASNANRLAIYRKEKYDQAIQYQKRLGDWQNQTFQKFADSAQTSLTGQYASMLGRLNQQRDQALEQSAQYDTSADAAVAQLRAAAGDQATGNSVLLAKQAYERAAVQRKRIAYKNLDAQIRQAEQQMLAMQAQTQSRVNQALPPPMRPIDPAQPVAAVHQPSMMPYILQGASGALGAAAHYQQTAPNVQPTVTNANTGPITGGLPPGYTPNFNPGFSGY